MTEPTVDAASSQVTLSAVNDRSEPEIGSAEWLANRKVSWDAHARDLLAALVRYEDEHPQEAICLAPALKAARRTVARA